MALDECTAEVCLGAEAGVCQPNSVPGLLKLYYAAIDNVATLVQVDTAFKNGLINAITMKAGHKFNRIHFDQQAGAVGNTTTDGTSRVQGIIFNIVGQGNETLRHLDAIEQILNGVAIIGQMQDGSWFYWGDTRLARGLRMVSGDSTSGRVDGKGNIDLTFTMDRYTYRHKEIRIGGTVEGTDAWILANSNDCDSVDGIEITATGGDTITLASEGASPTKVVGIEWGTACTEGNVAINKGIGWPADLEITMNPVDGEVDTANTDFELVVTDTGTTAPGDYSFTVKIGNAGPCADSNTITFTVTVTA